MGSRLSSKLSSVFAPADDWPSASMTTEEDLLDLKRHESEFDLRLAFAYTIVSRGTENDVHPQTLGCIYINPATRAGFDAEVFWWTISHDDKALSDHGGAAGLDRDAGDLVRSWMVSTWPFQAVIYPGRPETPWDAFDQLPYREEAVPRLCADATTIQSAVWRSCGLARC